MHIHSYAKINLGLHILRKREDGYHDIQTIFHRVNVSDQIAMSKKAYGIHLRCNLPFIPTDERNLCVRAAKLIFDKTGYTEGVEIDLHKQIPVGAGLGGGSSNAAAILQHLPSLIGESLDSQTMFELAAQLGSDVPFFLEQKTAFATGRGEDLQYFACALPYSIVIVYPGVHVSTKWAYKNFRVNSSLAQFDLKDFFLSHVDQPRELVNKLRNDFEPLVFRYYEEVMRTKEIFYRTGADFALMSGSGSSVFGLFCDENYARETMEFFKKKYPVFLTPPQWHP